MSATVSLALRSLLWTLLLPGFFAGYVPWKYFGLNEARLDTSDPVSIMGVLCIAAGALLLGACIVEFARSGRGTLSPLDPPRRLVVCGLYRHVRNPMYLSVTVILLGEVLVLRSWALALDWAIWFLCVNLFVIGYEEPTLRREFGSAYDEYARQVRRWIPRVRSGPVLSGEAGDEDDATSGGSAYGAQYAPAAGVAGARDARERAGSAAAARSRPRAG